MQAFVTKMDDLQSWERQTKSKNAADRLVAVGKLADLLTADASTLVCKIAPFLLDENCSIRMRALRALFSARGCMTRRLLRDSVPGLCRGLAASDKQLRVEAAELLRIASDGAVATRQTLMFGGGSQGSAPRVRVSLDAAVRAGVNQEAAAMLGECVQEVARLSDELAAVRSGEVRYVGVQSIMDDDDSIADGSGAHAVVEEMTQVTQATTAAGASCGAGSGGKKRARAAEVTARELGKVKDELADATELNQCLVLQNDRQQSLIERLADESGEPPAKL